MRNRLCLCLVLLVLVETSVLPSCTSSYSAPTRYSAPTTYKVVYSVTGSASEVSLTYENSQGGTEQIGSTRLPWQKTFTMQAGAFVYISAQNQGEYGSVTCTISVNGYEYKKSTSSGAYVIASASGTVEQGPYRDQATSTRKPTGKSGYAPTYPTSTPEPVATRGPTATLQPYEGKTTEAVGVRSGHDDSCPIVETLPAGTELRVMERDESCSWLRVRTSTDHLGWIRAEYLELQRPCTSWGILHQPCTAEKPSVATPRPTPVAATRDEPVPFGLSFLTPDGFEITILSVNPDAWLEVQAMKLSNKAPAAGNRMVLLRLRVKNVSSKDDPATWSRFSANLFGSYKELRTTIDPESSCGPISYELSGVVVLYRGEQAEGNICFQIPADETGLLLWYSHYTSDVYFAAEP